jgi:undecaprenyl-diphosphatase
MVGTSPVGITGLALEHGFRVLFAVPAAAAAFLTLNGGILLAGERLRRRADVRAKVEVAAVAADSVAAVEQRHAVVGGKSRRLETLGYTEAGVIGLFQTFALLAGISRSGVTMVGGLVRGLDHEDAAKFAFLLATPVILAAGLLKIPTLFGPAAAGIHGQVVVGAVTAGISAYLT